MQRALRAPASSLLLAAAGLAAAPAAAQQVAIDFDQLSTAARVGPAEWPEAVFSPMAPANGVMTYATPMGSSPPNFICTSVDETITCLDPLSVDFPLPVRHLTFFAVGVNRRGRAASVRVFEQGQHTATVDVIGSGHGALPVLVDLSSFVDVTRIELYDVDDPYGVGWDDFAFEIQHAPAFDPPTPCAQTLVAYAGQPLDFRVVASDVVPGELLSLESLGLPAGAALDPALPVVGNPVTCDVTWTPTIADIGLHPVRFVVSDGVMPPVACDFTLDVRCPSSWSTFGAGLAGSGDIVPSLTGRCAVTGETTWVDVTGGLGDAMGCILLGDTLTNFPVFGGTLYVVPSWTHTHRLSGTGQPGEGTFSLPLFLPPSPALEGATFYFQAGYKDMLAPKGISLTNALEVTIG